MDLTDFEDDDLDFDPHRPAQYTGTDTWLRAVETLGGFVVLEIAPKLMILFIIIIILQLFICEYRFCLLYCSSALFGISIC